MCFNITLDIAKIYVLIVYNNWNLKTNNLTQIRTLQIITTIRSTENTVIVHT